MGTQISDTEKAVLAYHDDYSNGPQLATYLRQEQHEGDSRQSKWRRLMFRTIIFASIILLLVGGRVLGGPISKLWHKSRRCDVGRFSLAELESLHKVALVSPDSVTAEPENLSKAPLSPAESLEDTPTVVSGSIATYEEAGIEGGPILLPLDPDVFVMDGTPGISLAAAIDPNGNRQLFDLTSTGVIRLRKSAANSGTWTAPEIVAANPRPKLKSPLAAISRPGTNGASNVRLYYLDATNRVVELACNACGPTAPCQWNRQTYFTATASGGLTVIWMGSYDGIRVFYMPSNGILSSLQWFQGKWTFYSTGLALAPTSQLTIYQVLNSSSTTTMIYILGMDTSGALKELVWDRGRGEYSTFFEGRVIDANFGSTHSNTSIGSAYGLPDTYMRVYYLDSGVMERYATISSDIWDQTWQRMWPSLQPDNPGGAVAGLEWGNTEVRVYYMNGGSIHEIALTDGSGWWSSGHID